MHIEVDHLDVVSHGLAAHLLYVYFFNATVTTEIYTLSLHDALPISIRTTPATRLRKSGMRSCLWNCTSGRRSDSAMKRNRSEEHTSELQSRQYLVCRLLLEKKKPSRRPGRTQRSRSRQRPDLPTHER